jgi:hypothetical protein
MVKLVDTPDLGSGAERCPSSSLGWGTKLNKVRNVAQLGSASVLGTEGRRFESCHSDDRELAQLVRAADS